MNEEDDSNEEDDRNEEYDSKEEDVNNEKEDYDNILIIDETRYIENNLKFILMFIIIILF